MESSVAYVIDGEWDINFTKLIASSLVLMLMGHINDDPKYGHN